MLLLNDDDLTLVLSNELLSNAFSLVDDGVYSTLIVVAMHERDEHPNLSIKLPAPFLQNDVLKGQTNFMRLGPFTMHI